MKPGILAPLFSACALVFFVMFFCGVNSGCRPALEGNGGEKKSHAAATARFELRLASDQPVEGWERRILEANRSEIFISPEVSLTNADLADAWFQPRGEEFTVGLYLTAEGALKLARLTGEHIGEKLAILVDGKVLSAPFIMGQVSDRAEIHGRFTEQEARDLAAALDPDKES